MVGTRRCKYEISFVVYFVCCTVLNVQPSHLCDNMACFNAFAAVYTACDLDEINDAIISCKSISITTSQSLSCAYHYYTVCNGSVQLYIAPVFILLTALFASIF